MQSGQTSRSPVLRRALLALVVVVVLPALALVILRAMNPKGTSHYHAQASNAMQERRYRDAIAALETARAIESSPDFVAGPGNVSHGVSSYWMSIGRAHEELEEWEAALDAYDRVIEEGDGWAYVRRAHCMRRSSSLDAAMSWLEELAASRPEQSFGYVIGQFLLESDEPGRAALYFEEIVQRSIAEHDYRFDDEGWFAVPEESPAQARHYAGLESTLELLAECLYRSGSEKEAFRYATMGVAVGQRSAANEGGNVACRAIRARVLMDRGIWAEAEEELRLARVRAGDSAYTGWREAIANAERELEARQ